MNLKIKYNDLEAVISSKGAELKSFKCLDVEYIWNSDPKYWGRSAPFLFPVIGTCKDKKVNIDGVIYDMPKHGLIRDQEYTVLSHSDNSIQLMTEYDECTLKNYPFRYRIIVSYELLDKLTTSVKVINLGNKNMPFNFGGHPAFMCPIYQKESFDDYKIVFEKPESFISPKVESNATLNFNVCAMKVNDLEVLKLDKSLFDIDTIIITNVQSKYVKLVNKNNKGIKFTFDDFNTLSIWTPKNDAPFICLEPWIGYNDRFDTDGDFYKKDDLITLKENEEVTVSYSIEIINM